MNRSRFELLMNVHTLKSIFRIAQFVQKSHVDYEGLLQNGHINVESAQILKAALPIVAAIA